MPREVVLVIDDYADSRVAVRDLLEDNGYQVVEAANGQEALSFLAAGVPRVQLIILDLQMPIMNGWQFLTALESHVRLSATPVLVVSARHPLPSQETHTAVAGCLKVPYSADQLLAAVKRHCRPSPTVANEALISLGSSAQRPATSKADADVPSRPALEVPEE
jgi:CheY-like chemotaxis protein